MFFVFIKDVFQKIKDVIDLYDSASTIIGFISYVIIIILAIAWLFGIDRKIINNHSKKQIYKLTKSKKYIRGLFVELTECKESLRFFANKSKWKKRLVRDYNSLFNDYDGCMLKEAFNSNQVKLKLSTKDSLDVIINTIKNTEEFLEALHNGRIEPEERYADSIIRFRIYSNKYDEALHEMYVKAQMMEKPYCVLIGSAGNGKTNMLCSFSELLIAMRKRVVYIDGKNIEKDVDSYMWKQYGMPQIIDTNLFRRLYYLFLRIRRTELFYVIDAINENDKEISDELVSFIDRNLSYKHVRILISCRSEYFNAKYKNILVNNVTQKPLCIDLQDSEYNQESLYRLFNVYKKAFNYTGSFNENVKKKLCKQLLTMRIFFEINENSSRNYLDLNTHTLIKEYIKKITDEKGVDVDVLLFEIARHMINQKKYSEVSFSLLSSEGKKIQRSIEDTMLTSKTILVNEGKLLEDTEIVVKFVYDEVRDYCLAREFLINAKQNDNYLKTLIETIDELISEKAVCTEGVIKYIYRDAHANQNNNLCQIILKDYTGEIDGYGLRQRVALSWTLQLIFDAEGELLECEYDYIKNIIEQHKKNTLSMLFAYLVEQEKIKGKYTLDLILNTIRKCDSKEEVSKIISNCIGGFGNNNISLNDFIDIDMYLKDNDREGLSRFREFAVLYMGFWKWEGRDELINYYKKSQVKIEDIISKIKSEYAFVSEGEGK